MFSPRTNSSSTLGSPEPDPSPSPSPAPDTCDCKILIDGESIAGKRVLPGEEINLRLKCEEGTPESITWTISKSTFKDYNLDTPKNAITYLEDKDLHGISVTPFYWSDAGKKVISVKFKVGSKDCKASTIIDVIKPDCELVVESLGEVGVSDGILRLLPVPPAPPTSGGIVFRGKVTIPSDFPKGLWAFVQTLNDDMQAKQTNESQCILSTYFNETCADGTQPHSGDDTGKTAKWADQPGVGIVSSDYQYTRSSPCFATYVVFKPKDGKWVPLKVVKWTVWGCTEGLSVKKKGRTTKEPIDTSKHPLWDHAYFPGTSPTTAGDCPADPGCENWTPRSCP